MLAKSVWRDWIVNIFRQIVLQKWASHTKWSLAEHAAETCYSTEKTSGGS